MEEVDPENPIDIEKYRALLVVQPSSLTPPQFDNVLAAVRKGIPTAVFEDPLPIFMQGVPGTSQPKPPQGMFGGPPPEKADVKPLLDLLGISMLGTADPRTREDQVDVVWQRYNPYETKLRVNAIPPEWVFVRNEAPGAYDPTNEEIRPFAPTEKLTKGLEEVLFPAPGAIKRTGEAKDLEFEPLVTTGDMSGTVSLNDIQANQGNELGLEKARGQSIEGRRFTLAAWIHGKDAEKEATEKKEEGDKADAPKGDKPINVIFVADIDLMAPPFVYVRARPQDEINWRFDNVTLVLNVLDALAGDDSFLDIRKRKVRHATLTRVEKQTEAARANVEKQQAAFQEEFDEAVKKARADMEDQFASVQKRLDALMQKQQRGEEIDLDQVRRLQQELQIKQGNAQRRFDVKQEQLRREQQRDIKRINQELEQNIRRIQSGYKLWALILPVIPPLLIGLIVFVRRRLREREGISRARLK